MSVPVINSLKTKISGFAIICIFLVCLTVESISQQQNNQGHYTGISSGLTKLRIKDDLASPVQYSGNTVPVYLNYSLYTTVYHIYLEAGYLQDTYHSSIPKGYGNHTLRDKRVNFRTLFLKRMNRNEYKRLSLFLGCAVEGIMARKTYSYLGTVSTKETFGDLALSLSIAAQVYRKISAKNSITVSASIPVAGVVTRPEYSGGGRYKRRTSFFNKLMIFKTGITAERKMFSGLFLRVGFELEYFKSQYPRTIQTGRDSVTLSLIKKLW